MPCVEVLGFPCKTFDLDLMSSLDCDLVTPNLAGACAIALIVCMNLNSSVNTHGQHLQAPQRHLHKHFPHNTGPRIWEHEVDEIHCSGAAGASMVLAKKN
jgi:hypothetical protein